MTDKQIIIDELKNEIACKENIINHLAEHNIKLQMQFKEKEQECEYWKHQAELGLDTTDTLVKELEEKEQECEELKETIQLQNKMQMEVCEEKNTELDQLKAENEELKEEAAKYRIEAFKQGQLALRDLDRNYKLKQTLTKIKEIVEENIRIADLEGLNGVYRRGLAKQILQKINEVEDDKSNN